METQSAGCGVLALVLAFVVIFLGAQTVSMSTDVSVESGAPVEASAAP